MRKFIAAGIVISLLLLLSLMACTTARRAMCPEAQVISITETDTAYIVTLVDDCQNKVVKIAK